MFENFGRPRRAMRYVWVLLLLVGLLLPPFYLGAFWLQVGLFAMAAVIGAIGLNLLLGTAGQLSLGHAFFAAVGAYTYVWAAGESGRVGALELSGLNLPPFVAFIVAVLVAGLAGALFSPVAGRVRGVYLAVATLALIFVGQHFMLNAKSFTGGFNGRSVPEMEILGLTFGDGGSTETLVMGVPFGSQEKLWYFGLALVIVAWLLARNLLNGRPGHALAGLRDSELAASVLGVPVSRYRAAVFTISSMFAGCSGAMLGLAYERLVPSSFGLTLSISFVAMIVIGGLGSVSGAAAGAVFVAALPQVVAYYAASLPLVAAPGSGEPGMSPVEASHFVYGAAIICVLLFAPGGLAGLAKALYNRGPSRPRRRPSSSTDSSPLPTESRLQ